MPNEELSERVSKLEVKSDEHQRLLNVQANKNEVLTRLSILMERQIDDSKEFKTQMGKFSETLTMVNDNLTNLNSNQQQIKQDMTEIGERVADIERHQDEQKVDTSKLFKVIFKELGKGILTIAIAYLLYKWGISYHN